MPPTAQDANFLRLRLPCAVDSYEFTALNDMVTVGEVEPKDDGAAEDQRTSTTLTSIFEHKPHFHEWL